MSKASNDREKLKEGNKEHGTLLMWGRLFLMCTLVFPVVLEAQQFTSRELSDRVGEFKKDIRGPHKDLRWFCTDGSMRAPKDPCPDDIGPGVQHARYKDVVVEIGNKNGIFLGQILACHKPLEFWKPEENFTRLKQYQEDQMHIT